MSCTVCAMNEPPLLTADEVGALLGVTGSTVRRRTRAGLIPAQRVGKAGQYLYNRQLIESAADDDGRQS